MENKQDNIAAMLENIKPQLQSVEVGTEKSAQVLLIPNGMKAEGIKKYLDEYKEKPDRRIGFHTADDIGAFIDITNRFKDEDSVIFAKATYSENSFKADFKTIFDFHNQGGNNTHARFGDHGVIYEFPISKEFSFWIGNNAKLMCQEEFSLMLEERVCEMASPTPEDSAKIANLKPKIADPIEVLELSRTLEIYSSDKINQAYKPQSGERSVKFTTEHSMANGAPVSIPDFFVISVPIFRGGDTVRVMVRLRYRKKEDKILWAYDLYRADNVFQEAFDDAILNVRAATELPLFLGDDGTCKEITYSKNGKIYNR
jgi:uncharacterized protein YfdQ (DUF2303 family)